MGQKLETLQNHWTVVLEDFVVAMFVMQRVRTHHEIDIPIEKITSSCLFGGSCGGSFERVSNNIGWTKAAQSNRSSIEISLKFDPC